MINSTKLTIRKDVAFLLVKFQSLFHAGIGTLTEVRMEIVSVWNLKETKVPDDLSDDVVNGNLLRYLWN